MFVGMSKNFLGFSGILFIDLKVTYKKLHQVTLFHTTGARHNRFRKILLRFDLRVCGKNLFKNILTLARIWKVDTSKNFPRNIYLNLLGGADIH